MLIFGTRGFTQTSTQVVTYRCSRCGNAHHGVGGLVRYFHLYWIPCFAYTLEPLTQCLNCRYTVSGEQIPAGVRAELKQTLFTWANIWWCFSGLMLAGVALTIALLAPLFA